MPRVRKANDGLPKNIKHDWEKLESMNNNQIKVLYISGVNRSGSTVLTKVLNEIEGFFGVNEIVLIGPFGLKGNLPLSNGELFHDNKVWNNILKDAYGEIPHWKQLSFYGQPTPRLLNLVFDNFKLKKSEKGQYEAYLNDLGRLYRSIQKETGCKVIVDSSKAPEYAYQLSKIEDIDLYVLHLTRDPRGIFYSHQKVIQRKDMRNGPSLLMKREGMINFIVKYIARNIASLKLKRKAPHFLKVRYEDFAHKPGIVLAQICEFLNYDCPEDLVKENTVHLSKDDYGIWGNPMRSNRDKLQIIPDTQWHNKLLTWQKVAVTVLALPFIIIYGYKVNPKKPQ